jgi:DnaJ-class molecular chaperone
MPETRDRNKVAKVACVLCDGGGRVPPHLAEMYGRPRGTTKCPSCDGTGLVRAVLAGPLAPAADHRG